MDSQALLRGVLQAVEAADDRAPQIRLSPNTGLAARPPYSSYKKLRLPAAGGLAALGRRKSLMEKTRCAPEPIEAKDYADRFVCDPSRKHAEQIVVHYSYDICQIGSGAFTPVLAKHSKSFSLTDCISVGVDRMQRNFEPMRRQVEAWQKSELTDVTAKVVIYEAFVELEAPRHLARTVHDLYFEPKYEEFKTRTIWSLSNAFTSAFKELDPIPQFRATAKLGEFLETRFSQSF